MASMAVSESLTRQPAPPPPHLNIAELFAGPSWHQRWEVFRGVFTPGRNDVAALCDFAQLPKDLTGKRVLDIGAWNGCFSFECERRGAEEVVALTMEVPETIGLKKLGRALGSKVVRNVEGSVYDLDVKQLGQFDVVLFFGVLYHLRYPLLAIDKIRSVTRGEVLVETHLIDEYWMQGRKSGSPHCKLAQVHRDLPKTAIWRYYHNDELMGDRSNFFGPNIQAVLEGFTSAGFSTELLSQWGDRGTFRGVPMASLDESLKGAYEVSSTANRNFLSI